MRKCPDNVFYKLFPMVLLAILCSLQITAIEQELKGDNKIFLSTGLMIRKVVDVNAALDNTWEAWTTDEGVRSFFAPGSRIELGVGGDYELYFDPKGKPGQKGSENCKILSFLPGEMLSFTWNNPPSIPEIRNEHTWVVIFFQSLEEQKTRVTLAHLGWQAGESWQKALKYFDQAWDLVLGRLQYRFLNGPLDWKNPFTPDKKK
jgi:uncharacterized protein YndB with AHSA1/START domain